MNGDVRDYKTGEKYEAIVTDPPYAIGKAKWDELTLKEYEETVLDNLERLFRKNVRKDGVLIMFVSQTFDWFVKKYWLDKGYEIINAVVWHYENGNRKSTYSFPMSYEVILIIGKEKKTAYRCPRDPTRIQKGVRKKKNYRKDGTVTLTVTKPNPEGIKYTDVLTVPRVNASSKERTKHPTQKPEKLMRILLKGLKKGSTVLDPFMGSGTTGVAAIKLGMHFVGIELSKEYYAIASDRLSKTAGDW